MALSLPIANFDIRYSMLVGILVAAILILLLPARALVRRGQRGGAGVETGAGSCSS